MKALKYVLILVIVIVGGYTIYLTTLSGHYDTSRSRTIMAPTSVIFSYVNDFKEWPKWSPWSESFEGDMKITYDGNNSGIGAKYYWTGEESGDGNMEIINSTPYKSIDQKINFTAPFESTSDIYWTFEETTDGVIVTWGMKGDMSFFMRPIAAGMDEAMEKDFLRGLEKLDSISVNTTMKSSHKVNGIVEYSGTTYAGIYSEKVSMENTSAEMGKNYGAIMTWLNTRDVKMTGAPFTIYTFYNDETKESNFISCIPIPKMMPGDKDKMIKTDLIKPTKAVKITHMGDYSEMENSWNAGFEYLAKNKLEVKGNPFEVYLNDPGSVKAEELLTEIYFPIK